MNPANIVMKTELISTQEVAAVMDCSQPNVSIKAAKEQWQKHKKGRQVFYSLKTIAQHLNVTQKSLREKIQQLRGDSAPVYSIY